MLHAIIDWLVQTVGSLGYPGIVLLMGLESSFFPFPSEVVMIPAGYLVHQGEMNVVLVITCGVIGSLLGAWLNYFIARTVGRAALLRWGSRIFLPPETFLRVEKYLQEHGAIGTFIGRLIPVIRQYISFPAGVVKMNILKFTAYTAVGSAIWSGILTTIGYYVGANKELVAVWSQRAVFWVLLGCILIIALYAKLRR